MAATDDDCDLAADLVGVAVAMMHFGPKPVVQGLSAAKMGKFSEEAKAVMRWAGGVYNTNKDRDPTACLEHYQR